jgi:hypothetical protein
MNSLNLYIIYLYKKPVKFYKTLIVLSNINIFLFLKLRII